MTHASDSPLPDRRRPDALALVVIVALALCAVVAVWAAAVKFDRASYLSALLGRAYAGNESDLAGYDNRVHGASVALTLTMLATAAVFITWFAFAIRRLHAARPDAFRYGWGWAIGGWFVPLFNFVQPKQMVNDAWRAAYGRAQVIPRTFHFWWALSVTGFVVLSSGNQLTHEKSVTLKRFVDGDRIAGTGASLLALAAVLAMVVVARLDVGAARVKPAEPGPWTAPVMAFNPAPGWPPSPPGWVPPPGWQPDPSWPQAPANWPFWIPVEPVPGVSQ